MSNTNSHAGLTLGVAGLRQSFPPPPNLTNKPSPSPLQYSSIHHPSQAYQPQQHSPNQYPHHLYTPRPQLNSVASLQNAARPSPPALPGPRQRAPAPRQMQQQQTPPLSYLQQSLNQQPLGQQPMPQQSISQPPTISHQTIAPQSMPQTMNPQPMNPSQQLSQPSLGQQSLGQSSLSQPMSQQLQQPISQPPMAPSMTQSMSQQSLSQSMPNQSITQSVQPAQHNDTSMLSQQSTPRPQHQPTLPPAPQQMTQMQQSQKAQQVAPQVQQIQQVQSAQQQPAAGQPDSAEPVQENHDDDMEGGSHDEAGEGASSLEPKLIENSPFVPRQPMGPMMSAPPEGGSFPTLEAIHKHVLSYCTSVGYAVVIGRSKKTVPGLRKVLFVCDRAGKPPRRVSPEMRKRKTTSRKCDCQFGFFAIEQRTQWTLRYRPNAIHLQHNHGPSESPLLHPAARKLDSKMVAAVKQLKDNGVGVSQTLEILQQENPHVPLLPRDIYNARAAINRNPQKVASGLAENRPAIYSKPHPSPEERIRADLRRELAKTREELDRLKEDSKKEIEELKEKLREKDKIIEKFEEFIDICNHRVTVKLHRTGDSRRGETSSS